MVVLFDGVCNLCNTHVNWVIDRDPDASLRFLTWQSEAGRAIAARSGLDPNRVTTLVAIENGTVRIRSDAVLHIGRSVRSPVSRVAAVLMILPRPLRDAAYRVFARLRYHLFGRKDVCRVPTPGLARHFLDPDDASAAIAAAGFEAATDDAARARTA